MIILIIDIITNLIMLPGGHGWVVVQQAASGVGGRY